MAQIFVIHDPAYFKASALDCIVLPTEQGLDALLSKGLIGPLQVPAYTEKERSAFIQDYTALIASLNARFKDQFLWWATDLSSKNSYVCPVPDLVQELLMIERSLSACPDQPLLIAGPSIAIEPSLSKLLAKCNRSLVWPKADWERQKLMALGAARSLIRLLVRAVRFYARSFLSRRALSETAGRWLDPQKNFYVIKTFSYPSSWDKEGAYTDAFFGPLPKHLAASNQVLILSYHWHCFGEFIKRLKQETAWKILPVEFFINGGDVFRAVIRILSFRIELKEPVLFKDLDVTDLIRFELARTLNGIQIFQLLHYDALRHLIRQVPLKDFLMTFENNPWERMCLMALRKHSPSTKLLGYQHSVVPQAALNMFVHPNEKNIVPLPDRILTTGELSRGILRAYGDYGQVPILSSCALRYEYLFAAGPKARSKSQGHLLLVLDGVDQTFQMLQYVLKEIRGAEGCRLRIRCHPALPWSLLTRKHPMDMACLSQVEISKESLAQDLEWADVLMYWQSAVVLEAVSRGIPAVNFRPEGLLSYDPLFLTDAFQWTVTPQERLLAALKAVEAMDDREFRRRADAASAWVRSYFHPVTPQSLALFEIDG